MIERCSFPDLEAEANFPALLEEYAVESRVKGMPPPKCKNDLYRHLDRNGQMHIWRATHEGLLTGFLILVVPVSLHYSKQVAVIESFFVGKSWRRTGAGLRLLRGAEELAREFGCPGIVASSPVNGRLAEVLPRMGYTECSRAFFKPVEKRDLVPVLEVPATPPAVIDQIRKLEVAMLNLDQVDMVTSHRIHAGMYSRTILVPAGIAMTAAVIKIATQLTIAGDAEVFMGDGWARISGYAVLTASPGRKQMVRARRDTFITMSFGTAAKTVAEAEAEFTDEADQLWSRRGINDVLVTGE